MLLTLLKSARRMNTVLKFLSLGLIFSIVMQNFAAIPSVFLEKMTFEVVIFGYFPDIPKLKLSLPP